MSDNFTMGPETDLTGRVAVITGAACEIGLALALHAADRGMMVALADDDEYLLSAALEQVRAKHVEAIAIQSDMLDFASVSEVARRSAGELGPPWLVCNSPGESLEVNLWSVINGVRVFAPDMVKRGGGHIINIAATELLGTRAAAPSVAAKHAIVGLSQALYRELDFKGSHVGVTLVCPPRVATDLTSATENGVPPLLHDVLLEVMLTKELAERIFAAVALRRFWVPLTQMHDMRGPDAGSGARADS
jgi:NAD(P)-dependent dehydrogenase (short-subunit alcohol dehydrogenase family)